MILLNATTEEIRQMFCQKTYIWPAGHAMTLPDDIGAWMLQKVNSREGGNADPAVPRLVPQKPPKGKREEIPDPNVIRAEIAPKDEKPPAAPAAAPAK